MLETSISSHISFILNSYLQFNFKKWERIAHLQIHDLVLSAPQITKVIHKLKNSNSVGWYYITTNIITAKVNILAPIISN